MNSLWGRIARSALLGLAVTVPTGFASGTQVPQDSLAALRRTFEQRELSDRHWFLGTDSTQNLAGGYAWVGSAILEAELEAFEATRDTVWLHHFAEIADRIISQRDDSLGRKDWRGTLGPGWGESRKFKPGVGAVDDHIPVRYLVDDAMIAAPLARFAYIVLSDTQRIMSVGMQQAARRFTQCAQEVADYHIRTGWDDRHQEFRLPRGTPVWWDGINVPRNYEAAAGRLLIYLDLQRKDPQRAAILRKIVEHFRQGFQLADSSYVWSYWSGTGYSGWTAGDSLSVNMPASTGQKTVEDLGHGSIDVAFVLAAFKYGYGFERNDIGYLLHTLRHSLPAGRRPAATVDGKGSGTMPVFGWFDLATFDCAVARTLSGYYLPINRTDPQLILTLAVFLRTPRCVDWSRW